MSAAQILQLALLATELAERLVSVARDLDSDDPIEIQHLGDRLSESVAELRQHVGGASHEE